MTPTETLRVLAADLGSWVRVEGGRSRSAVEMVEWAAELSRDGYAEATTTTLRSASAYPPEAVERAAETMRRSAGTEMLDPVLDSALLAERVLSASGFPPLSEDDADFLVRLLHRYISRLEAEESVLRVRFGADYDGRVEARIRRAKAVLATLTSGLPEPADREAA